MKDKKLKLPPIVNRASQSTRFSWESPTSLTTTLFGCAAASSFSEASALIGADAEGIDDADGPNPTGADTVCWMRTKTIALSIALAWFSGCTGPVAAPTPKPAASTAGTGPMVPSQPLASAASIDARLRADLGGWTPSADLLDTAEALGDPARKPATLAALDGASLAHRIDVFRAGLRLLDDAAGRACAAPLRWQWIDEWECARCVDLLKAEVLRPGGEGDFEEFRSYLGTSDLPAFIDALPPLPWKEDDPAKAVSELHRILDEDSMETWAKLARHPDSRIADEAVTSWWATVATRCERHREDALRLLDREPGTTFPSAPAVGLSPALVDQLRRYYLVTTPEPPEVDPGTGPAPDHAKPMDIWTRRWCLQSTPGPQDEALLLDLARTWDEDDVGGPGGVAVVLLGHLRGEASDAWLREEAADDDASLAWMALAQRGDARAVEHLIAWSAEDHGFDSELPLAALLAADPAQGRNVIEMRVLGGDEALALLTLDQLATFLAPGWDGPAMAFDTSRVSWAGFEGRALATKMPALRRALLGVAVPACRTRAVAEAACRDLDTAFFATELPTRIWSGHEAIRDVEAFLETAAPEAFRAALRRVAAGEDEDARAAALDALLTIGDPASGAQLVELTRTESFGEATQLLGRSPAPEVLAYLKDCVRDRSWKRATGALAEALGAPEEFAWPSGADDDPVPQDVRDALLSGRWLDAFHALLAAQPDVPHGDVAIRRDDAAVRAYLERLRDRRELGMHWYAVGQLSAMGDAAARAEFWKALQVGRYRISYDADPFVTTLGGDLAATMPYWLDQLRGSCCKVVHNGEPWNDYFDVETFTTPWRTPYAVAKEIWDAGTGPGGRGFAWSRIRRTYVVAAR